ncbi:MAG: hypothetical protein WCS46_02160 [Bacteroidales bacterium]|jgi:hypothetical protein
MSRNKGKKRIKQPAPIQHQEEYDLKASLGRLNQRIDIESGSTISDSAPTEFEQQSINSTSILSNQGQTTSLYLHLNDSFNSRYEKLKDEISNVSEKITDSRDNLRTEIENKLNNKVNIDLFNKLFYGAISVIVVIASLIYLFSYSVLIKNVDSNKVKIDTIIFQLNDLRKNINEPNLKIDELMKQSKDIEQMNKADKINKK